MPTAITSIVQKVEVAKVYVKGNHVDMFVYLENDVVEFHHYLRRYYKTILLHLFLKVFKSYRRV
jgi:hypothetical protein